MPSSQRHCREGPGIRGISNIRKYPRRDYWLLSCTETATLAPFSFAGDVGRGLYAGDLVGRAHIVECHGSGRHAKHNFNFDAIVELMMEALDDC